MVTLFSNGAGAEEERAGAGVGGVDIIGASVVLKDESTGVAVKFELTGAVAGASVVNGAKVKGTGKGAALGFNVLKGAKVKAGLGSGGPVSGSLGVAVGV